MGKFNKLVKTLGKKQKFKTKKILVRVLSVSPKLDESAIMIFKKRERKMKKEERDVTEKKQKSLKKDI